MFVICVKIINCYHVHYIFAVQDVLQQQTNVF